MSFWNINIDDWIRGQLYLDENISAYMFHTTAWYGNNNCFASRSIACVKTPLGLCFI
jgi:hypothetical protein